MFVSMKTTSKKQGHKFLYSSLTCTNNNCDYAWLHLTLTKEMHYYWHTSYTRPIIPNILIEPAVDFIINLKEYVF